MHYESVKGINLVTIESLQATCLAFGEMGLLPKLLGYRIHVRSTVY